MWSRRRGTFGLRNLLLGRRCVIAQHGSLVYNHGWSAKNWFIGWQQGEYLALDDDLFSRYPCAQGNHKNTSRIFNHRNDNPNSAPQKPSLLVRSLRIHHSVTPTQSRKHPWFVSSQQTNHLCKFLGFYRYLERGLSSWRSSGRSSQTTSDVTTADLLRQ